MSLIKRWRSLPRRPSNRLPPFIQRLNNIRRLPLGIPNALLDLLPSLSKDPKHLHEMAGNEEEASGLLGSLAGAVFVIRGQEDFQGELDHVGFSGRVIADGWLILQRLFLLIDLR